MYEVIEEKNKVELAVARLAGALKAEADEGGTNPPIFVLVVSCNSSSQTWVPMTPGGFEQGVGDVIQMMEKARQYGVMRPEGGEPTQ